MIIFVSSECRVVVVVQIQVLFLVVASACICRLRDTVGLVVTAHIYVIIGIFARFACVACGGAGSEVSTTATAAPSETTATSATSSEATSAAEVFLMLLLELFLFFNEFSSEKLFFLFLESLLALTGVEGKLGSDLLDLGVELRLVRGRAHLDEREQLEERDVDVGEHVKLLHLLMLLDRGGLSLSWLLFLGPGTDLDDGGLLAFLLGHYLLYLSVSDFLEHVLSRHLVDDLLLLFLDNLFCLNKANLLLKKQAVLVKSVAGLNLLEVWVGSVSELLLLGIDPLLLELFVFDQACLLASNPLSISNLVVLNLVLVSRFEVLLPGLILQVERLL